MNNEKLYDENFYETNQKDLNAAQTIMAYIYDKIKPKSIVDFGCGSGTWLCAIKKLGCNNILGIDGKYVKEDWLLFEKSKFLAADLTENIELPQKYDMAISLEVAEHISEEKSETYLKNLTKASDLILFSAAIPYQGGTNHINEQFPSYWIKKFEKYGYVSYDCLRWKFWDNPDIAFWYRQNIMFFVKKEKIDELKKIFPVKELPTDLVHPQRLKNLVQENSKEKQDIENQYMEKIQVLKEENKQKIAECKRLEKEIMEKKEYMEAINKIYKPKVSIVVPVYNVKNYLRECLDSILNQTLSEIEVLCGDGGSDDGSLEILREYEKKDIRVRVISREGSGYGQSVNECMDIAKGEYIGLVESDDVIKKNMYETLYNIAKKNDLDWIKSDIYHYYSNLPKDQQFVRESITYGKDFYNQVLNPQNDVKPYKTALHTWAGLYKSEFLNRYHIRHHETPGGSYQDVGFHLKTLYYAERVYFIETPFYCWRQDNPNSSIHYNAAKLIEKSFNEWELNKNYLECYGNTNTWMWGSFNYRRYYSYLWTIEMANELKDKASEYARKELKEAMDDGKVLKCFFDEFEWNKFIDFIR